MMLCACFRPTARFEEAPAEAAAPQSTHVDLDAVKKVCDAPAAPATGRSVGKFAIDQTSTRDTYAESDSPRKAAPSPRPAALDAPASIWEKLASHEIRNLSPTPEPKEVTPEPARAFAAAAAMEPSTAELEREKTPDLTITGHAIKPMPAAAAAAAGVKPVSAKKPWGARSAPTSSNGTCDPMTTPPSARRASAGGERRKSSAGTPPSAGVPASLLKPTAASAARAQATTKPKADEAVWKH